MGTPDQIAARDGSRWRVQYAESAAIRHIDGVLLTYHDTGRIVTAAGLPREATARCRAALLQHLAATPAGTSGAALWRDGDGEP